MTASNLDWIHTAGTERLNERFSMKLENRRAGTGGYACREVYGRKTMKGIKTTCRWSRLSRKKISESLLVPVTLTESNTIRQAELMYTQG